MKHLNTLHVKCSSRFGICSHLLTGLEMVSRLQTYFIFLLSPPRSSPLLSSSFSSFSFMRINECYLHSAMQREKGHSREKRGGERGRLAVAVAPSLPPSSLPFPPSAGEIEERTNANINIKSVCKNVFNFRLGAPLPPSPPPRRRHRL